MHGEGSINPLSIILFFSRRSQGRVGQYFIWHTNIMEKVQMNLPRGWYFHHGVSNGRVSYPFLENIFHITRDLEEGLIDPSSNIVFSWKGGLKKDWLILP
jgi:hypothetical protein